MQERRIGVGIIGLGTVGCGALKILLEQQEELSRRVGARLEVVRLATRDPSKPRPVAFDPRLLAKDGWEVIEDPRVDIVVETIGGVGAAKAFVFGALERGKAVVTANKELMAKFGREILDLAKRKKVDVYFEGSVAGGIPIIQALKTSLIANRVTEIQGIVNGTTNYILTQMKQRGISFEEALREAQEYGYAEPDPSDDIEGHDAAYKIAILAAIAFTSHVNIHEVYREGIRRISPRDIAYADEMGYEIKLLALAKDHGEDMEIRVHPTLIPQEHPLASVHDVFNAVLVRGHAVGEVMFYGRGAGAGPAGSAVVADIVDIARNLVHGASGRVPCTCHQEKPLRPMGRIVSKYYMRTWVKDQPGVLAQVAGIAGKHQVSIESMVQKHTTGTSAELVWITHEVEGERMMAALEEIRRLAVVEEVSNVLRVER